HFYLGRRKTNNIHYCSLNGIWTTKQERTSIKAPSRKSSPDWRDNTGKPIALGQRYIIHGNKTQPIHRLNIVSFTALQILVNIETNIRTRAESLRIQHNGMPIVKPDDQIKLINLSTIVQSDIHGSHNSNTLSFNHFFES